MSAVLRLVWLYFGANSLTRVCTACGLVLVVIGTSAYVLAPAWSLAYNPRRPHGFFETFVLGLPWFGLLCLLAASALMPVIVERIVRGRMVWVLPLGRVRLLASVLLPPLLLATVTATAATLAFLEYRQIVPANQVFFRTLLMAFIDIGLIYMAIWLTSKTSGVWRLAGMLGAVLSITIPVRYVGGIPDFGWLEWAGLASWAAIAALLLSGGRTRHLAARSGGWLAALPRNLVPTASYQSGHEAELLLGTSRPWFVAFGQIVPIAVLVALVHHPEVWLVVLILFSAISGAITSQASARSRRLWLHYDWTRERIARCVELAYWKYNLWSLAVLLLMFVAVALYSAFDGTTILLGLVLLTVSSIVCTYLGLMITRGLGWFESILCVLTMVVLTIAGIEIVRQEWIVAATLLVALGALALVFRAMARVRWQSLDWMRCPVEAPLRA